MKISFIGAGSIGFTQTLVRDLLKVPEFQDIIFSFNDISEKNLELVSKLIQKDIDQNKLSAKIEQSTEGKSPLAAIIAIAELCTPAPKLIIVNVFFLSLSIILIPLSF